MELLINLDGIERATSRPSDHRVGTYVQTGWRSRHRPLGERCNRAVGQHPEETGSLVSCANMPHRMSAKAFIRLLNKTEIEVTPTPRIQ